MSLFLSIVIALPALGALALMPAYEGRAGRDSAARALAGVASLAAVLAALPLWTGFAARGDEWQATSSLTIVPALGAAYSVGIDGLSLILILLTVIGGAVMSWPWFGAAGDSEARPALVPVLVLETALLAAFAALDLLMLMLAWMVAVGGALVLMRRAGAPRSTLLPSLVTAVLGAAALAVVVVSLHGHYLALSNVASFDLRPLQRLTLPAGLQASLLAGCAVVIAATFFVGAALALQPGLRGVPLIAALGLFNLGNYLGLRIVMPILPDAVRAVAPAVVPGLLILALAAVVTAFIRLEWRRATALASVAYATVALLAAWTRTPDSLTASVSFLVALGLAMPALAVFGAYPSPPVAAGETPPPLAVARTRFAAALFVLALLTLAGFPGAGGFVALRLFAEGVWTVNRATAILGGAAIVLAAGSLALLFLRTITSDVVITAGHLRRRHLAPLAVLVALAVGIGLHPNPILSRLETSVARIVMRVSPEYAADVADCLKPRAPAAPPPDSGLPAGMAIAAPCEDGTSTPAAVPKPSGR